MKYLHDRKLKQKVAEKKKKVYFKTVAEKKKEMKRKGFVVEDTLELLLGKSINYY
tara:strand:+ start:182 stop:346 length:165 start_codon:yes stop_codon:yes gene_type:complete